MFSQLAQLSASNSFVARYSDNVSTRLAVLHSFYGLGALSSPLVATQFSQLRFWSFHYLVSLGLAIVNVAVLSFVFRFRTQEGEHRRCTTIMCRLTVSFVDSMSRGYWTPTGTAGRVERRKQQQVQADDASARLPSHGTLHFGVCRDGGHAGR